MNTEFIKIGFRFYFDKDYNYLIQDELKYYTSEYHAAINAKKRLRIYASLFCRDMRKKLINKNSICVYCGTNIKLHIDHIVPVSKGGENKESNIQILCSRCNFLKGNKI